MERMETVELVEPLDCQVHSLEPFIKLSAVASVAHLDHPVPLDQAETMADL